MGFSFFWQLKRPNLYIGIVYFALAGILIEEYFWLTRYIEQYTFMAEVSRPLALLIPPSLYLYTFHQYRVDFDLKSLFHFLPFFLGVLLFLPLYTESAVFKYCYVQEEIWDKVPENCPLNYNDNNAVLIKEELIDVLFIVIFFLYAIIIFKNRKLISAAKSKRVYSIFNNWGTLIGVCFAVAVLFQVLDIYWFVNDEGYFTILYLSSILIALGFYTMIQSNLLEDHLRSIAYEKVDDNYINQTYDLIKHTIIENALYNSASLTINDVVKEVNIPANKISFVLNKKGTNFRQLINSLRIDQALQLMNSKEGENYSLEGIGKLMGYKSKTTFYKYFKEKTGLTPKEYLDSRL